MSIDETRKAISAILQQEGLEPGQSWAVAKLCIEAYEAAKASNQPVSVALELAAKAAYEAESPKHSIMHPWDNATGDVKNLYMNQAMAHAKAWGLKYE